jgi:hypothetical protein
MKRTRVAIPVTPTGESLKQYIQRKIQRPRNVHFRVDDETQRRIFAVLRKQGISLQELCTAAIKKALDELGG